MSYIVKKQGPRTWAIYAAATGALVEGGFFSKAAAEEAAAEWTEGTR